MNKAEKQMAFASAFVVFMESTIGPNGAMSNSEFAAHLSVTLGRFMHDFVKCPHTRLEFMHACLEAIANVAFEDDEEAAPGAPGSSVH